MDDFTSPEFGDEPTLDVSDDLFLMIESFESGRRQSFRPTVPPHLPAELVAQWDTEPLY